ncbi:MAG: septation protein SepH [Micrococcus sp.]|nr:septation protein SepH [Micrococcus sp.]
MQELRLVGVQEDGGHLLLSNEDGEEFSLPVTDALRAAATRPIGRPSAKAADAAEGVMTPRDIQARIRAGATAEQVAAASGVDLERVRKYEGPVLAERDWIAHQARQVEVAAPQPGHDLYRGTFGENPALLGDMVRHRLAALGMDTTTAHWDAWRMDDGTWTVSLDFSTEGAESAIGDQPPALWSFRPSSRHLDNRNRWAQVLSELDPLDGAFGARRLAAVGDRPFNVEEDDAGPAPAPVTRGPRPAVDQDSQDELLDVLRARRGQRLGVDEEGDDELALMLTRDEHAQPSPQRPRLTVAAAPDDDASDTGRRDDDGPVDSAADGWVEVWDEDDEEDPRFSTPDEGTAGADEAAGADAAETEGEHPDQTTLELADKGSGSRPARSAEQSRPARPAKPVKSKRPSVPSWDEIVFGRKND